MVALIGLLIWACTDVAIERRPFSHLDSVYIVASDLYYWHDNLPELEDFDFKSHRSPESILSAFRLYSKNTVDKWSFAIEQGEWQRILQGVSGDFGMGLRFWGEEDLRIAYVQPNSPAGLAGLERGLQITAMNGLSVNYQNLGALDQEFQNANRLNLNIANGTASYKISLERKDYEVNPILSSEVFIKENKKIGYLNIFTFSKEALDGIKDAFNLFYSEGIDYIIIDLRYNGGGLIPVMEELANHLVCTDAYNQLMYQTEHNEVYEAFNSKAYFHETTNPICVKKVYFITAYKTASASEVLINAIKPYMDVTVVGTTTTGKLVGMHTIPFKNHILVPVSFKITNSNNDHDNFEGIKPNIEMIDGVNQNWGKSEACIDAIFNNIGLSQSSRIVHSFPFGFGNSKIIEDIEILTGAFNVK